MRTVHAFVSGQGEGVKGHPFAGCVTWEMLCSLHSFMMLQYFYAGCKLLNLSPEK